MDNLHEFKGNSIYQLVDLIDQSVEGGSELWNYDEDYFINSVAKFSKNTLLHLYIVVTAINYWNRYFRKEGDLYDEQSMNNWYNLFEEYDIEIVEHNFEDVEDVYNWFEENRDKFFELFDYMSKEVFYVLFANRNFLLKFNILISVTIKETNFPKEFLTRKGTVKRVNIPSWVKKAVFHRDKGRCIFCNTDLTGLINTLTNSNYDHIVPLDLHGPNDPCNIQLACEGCNKSKSNREASTSNHYMPWWPK